MRHFRIVWVPCLAWSLSLSAQNATPPSPQSARQALIEMFVGKGQDDFTKHLPDETRQSLIHKGETAEGSIVLKIASAAHEITRPGEHVETFDAGPNILISEDESSHERVEVAVEHDSLNGEEDEIELSVHVTKDGQTQPLPVIPSLLFTLKQQKDIWRLTELTVAAHVPLTDPDYLKALRKYQDDANEQMARTRVGMIVAGETSYVAAHPTTGYTCALANLSDPGQGNEDWNGYRFKLSGCGGAPAKRYRLLATPVDSDAEVKTFCADESGKVKFLKSGDGANCFSEGEAIDTPKYSSVSID